MEFEQLKLIDYIFRELDVTYDINNFEFKDIILYMISYLKCSFNEIDLNELINSYISDNEYVNFIIIYDSSIIDIKKNDNVICFDCNNNGSLENYNIILFDKSIRNIYIDTVVDSLMYEWPKPIEKAVLKNICSNNFLHLFLINKVHSYDEKEIIITKFMNKYFNTKIEIKYLGNDNTIKKYLTN